jgi:hypothetical protein
LFSPSPKWMNFLDSSHLLPPPSSLPPLSSQDFCLHPRVIGCFQIFFPLLFFFPLVHLSSAAQFHPTSSCISQSLFY